MDFKPFTAEKPWGNFRQFSHNSNSTVKIISVNAGEELSLQSHSQRSEFWKVIKGSGVIQIDDAKHEAREGDEYDISVSAKHRISAGPTGIQVLEIALGDFDENDITRYEDKYGRA